MSTPNHDSTTTITIDSSIETTITDIITQALSNVALLSQSSTTSQLTIQTLPDTPSYTFQVNHHTLDANSDTSTTLPTATFYTCVENLHISPRDATSHALDFDQHLQVLDANSDNSTSSTLPIEVGIYVENLHISPISSITPQYLALVAVLCGALVAVVVWVC